MKRAAGQPVTIQLKDTWQFNCLNSTWHTVTPAQSRQSLGAEYTYMSLELSVTQE